MTSEQISMAQLYDFVVRIVEEKIKDIKASKEEFDKLVHAIRNLARIVRKLAEAQKRTDERLQQLSLEVQRLAEAQKRTEERLQGLAEAQKRTDERLQQLSLEVQRLAEAVRNLSIAVGRLSDVVGFGLEDIARVMVPGWLERHEGIYVEDLQPKFFLVGDEEVQINLYGVGSKDGREIIVLGECKSRIYHHDVRRFVETLEKIRKVLVGKDIYAFLFGYLIHPRAEEEAKKYKIQVLATYMR